MEAKLFDIHCHLNLPEFAADRATVLDRTLNEGCWLINVGADLASSKLAVEIAKTKETGVWATVGFHPTEIPAPKLEAEAGAVMMEEFAELSELAKDPKVVAIGECGLEYYERKANDKGRMTNENAQAKKEEQKALFRKHIELALELDNPLMIHCRPNQGSQDAYEDTVDILREYKHRAGDKLCGNFHFFAGGWTIAQKCLDLGFTLSFTGVVTFSHQYDEVIQNTPIDMIMAETDAPFVAPVPYRGQRCEPLYVVEVVKRMAELRGITYEKMAQISVQNGRRVFKL